MSTESARMLDLHDLALEKDPVAQLIVDASGVLPTNKSQGTVPDPAVTSNE